MDYPSGKPFTRWWWFACEVRKTDITAQLAWFKANGFGGVEIAWIFPPRGDDPWDRIFPGIVPDEKARRQRAAKWLSPEWSENIAFAKAEADRLALGCDFTFGTLWPFGDTHVAPADASKQYDVPENKRVRYQLQFIRYSWEQPAEGLVIDHLDRGAFQRYAERVGKALEPAMRGSKSALFCDSWEVRAKALWTDGLDDQFSRRFGYDIRPFLPKLWDAANADARYDYLQLISDLVIANFYRPLTERAHQLGGFSRVQVAGAPVDPIEAYALIDVPETEAMLYEPPYGRVVASAAALAQRREVSSETFTCIYGFPDKQDPEKYRLVEQTADLKLLADALFANGVNQVVWHGAPFTPEGAVHDFLFYATVHVGREGALASELQPFNAYMESVSRTMKRGRTYSDLAMWLPLEDGRMAGNYPEEQQVPGSQAAWELRYVSAPEEARGHQLLWVTNACLKDAKVEGAHVVIGDVVFRALYVDVEFLALEGLETALRLARQGLPVVLKRIPKQPGRVKAPDYDRLLTELRAIAPADFMSVVVWPALVAAKDGQKLPDFWARVDGDTTLVFFAHPLAQGLKLPLSYGQSFTTETQERKVRIFAGGKEHDATLPFAPYQSLLVEVDSHGVRFIDVAYQPPPAKKEDP